MSKTTDTFNDNNEVGTCVLLTEDSGDKLLTQTTSEAWDICGTPCVMVDGKSGGYDLSRIEVCDP